MSRVGQKDTAPELAVRRAAHRLGLRFRIHRKDLHGTPDIVFPRYRTAVFVNGCYWHQHKGCRKAGMPKSNIGFWSEKFRRTVERDAQNKAELEASGWRVATIWECQTRNSDGMTQILKCIFGIETDKGSVCDPQIGRGTSND